MTDYRFSLTRIFLYKDSILRSVYADGAKDTVFMKWSKLREMTLLMHVWPIFLVML